MTLKRRIHDDMKSAMKAGDKDRLKVLRLILAAIKQQEVDQRTELDDPAVLNVLGKMVKQRHDSVSQFREGGRADLADAEEAEIGVLKAYLPEPLSETEVDRFIGEAIAETGAQSLREMGKVMAALKQKTEGRADLGAVSGKVKARLSE